MRREARSEKAARLLVCGAVRVVEAGTGYLTARVTGESGAYIVSRRRGGWWCSCPNPVRCSHLEAVQLVADPNLMAVPAALLQ